MNEGSRGASFLGKVGCFLCRRMRLFWAWIVKFARLRVQSWKLRSARKELDSASARLGVEVYALHKQGETNWAGSPLLPQRLKQVEQAESALFEIQDAVEKIVSDYQAKKQTIAEQCECRKDNEPPQGTS